MNKHLRSFFAAFGLLGASAAWAQPAAPALLPADSSQLALPIAQPNSVRSVLWRLFVDSSSAAAATDFGTIPKMEPARLRSLNVNGFYRFFGTCRWY